MQLHPGVPICILSDIQMVAAHPPYALLLDSGSRDPAYVQIARQIRAGISTGALPRGTALPPVRILASDLGVNLNTVARAYRLLEEEGFIRIRARSGAEVAPPARRAATESVARLRMELREILARLHQAGVGPAELGRITEGEIEEITGRDRETR